MFLFMSIIWSLQVERTIILVCQFLHYWKPISEIRSPHSNYNNLSLLPTQQLKYSNIVFTYRLNSKSITKLQSEEAKEITLKPQFPERKDSTFNDSNNHKDDPIKYLHYSFGFNIRGFLKWTIVMALVHCKYQIFSVFTENPEIKTAQRTHVWVGSEQTFRTSLANTLGILKRADLLGFGSLVCISSKQNTKWVRVKFGLGGEEVTETLLRESL